MLHPNPSHEPRRPNRAGNARLTIEGLSADAALDFCEAIDFAIAASEPTGQEIAELRAVLSRIARDEIARRREPELGLLALRAAWKSACRGTAAPDMHNPQWHVVVREWLSAYDEAR